MLRHVRVSHLLMSPCFEKSRTLGLPIAIVASLVTLEGIWN